MFTTKTIELFYLFFEGIMLFQVVFFGMVYLISKRKDVLYYSLLNFFAAAYFFLNAPDTFLGIDENIIFNSTIYLYVNFAILLAMVFTYLIFLKEIFNDTVQQYSYVKKVYNITFFAIPILYLLFVAFTFFGWHTNIIFYTGYVINAPFCTLILILNFRQRGYKKLVINGMLVVFVCVNITMAFTIRYNAGSNETILDKYPLVIIKLGMLIDILLFQLALLKRWNDQEKELAIEKLQSQLEVEKVRNKISTELHDDIGSTLSGISMYSHMTDNLLQSGHYDKVKDSLGVIQNSANEIVSKLGDLVWAINPGKDSPEIMLERIKKYGIEMCGAKGIVFTANFSPAATEDNLPMENRRQIYLIMKEAINNAVKYSNANHIHLCVEKKATTFLVQIKDNGSGLPSNIDHTGNGLKNMKKRAEEIGGELVIESMKEKGTTVNLTIKITQ